MESNKHVISGKTALYGVVGDPVDHSMSPIIQNAAFRSAGLNAVYIPFQVKSAHLATAVQGLRALDVKGFNVTSPHKIKVLPHLGNLDRTASGIGSVNTVLNKDGILIGYNTDGEGALKALEEAGAPLDRSSVLLFGAGGASRAIAYGLAARVRRISIINRTLSRAKGLSRFLERQFEAPISAVPLNSHLVEDLVRDADVIINASSMGMDGRADPPIQDAWLRADQWVFDIVYKPLETKLLRLASIAGAKTVTGLDLLVNQGARSFEIWTGMQASTTEMRRAISQLLTAVTHATSR